ncbi:MAG: glycosyltransferase [Lachnospiraceae bacterium]|nr:glycosyltransferase [Lachnospiraceae bacterium]
MKKESQIKISIIVPVYQAEKYLEKCLDSLEKQNLDDYEIICIDDGSTDASGTIIREFAQKRDNIVYIHQENKGVSAARNQGLKAARGKYIMFVDADDYIQENVLKYLFKKCEKNNVDILAFGGSLDLPFQAPEWMRMAFYTKNKVYSSFAPEILYFECGAQPSITNKIFYRECLQGIFFNENIHIAEDLTFLFLAYPKASNIVFSSKSIYRYRMNPKSAMHLLRNECVDYMNNHLLAAEIIIREWSENGYLSGNNQRFAEWLTPFLREPFNLLTDSEKRSLEKRIDDIYESIGLDNQLLIPESVGDDKFTIKRMVHILSRDICRYGVRGGLENIIYKLLYR